MIVYDKLWKTMEKKGITIYMLREQLSFDSRMINRLKENQTVKTDTLDKLCAILDCRLDEIATYIKD